MDYFGWTQAPNHRLARDIVTLVLPYRKVCRSLPAVTGASVKRVKKGLLHLVGKTKEKNQNRYPIELRIMSQQMEHAGGAVRRQFCEANNWDLKSLLKFEKSSNKKHLDVAAHLKAEVDAFRKELQIAVQGRDVPKHITSFDEAGFPRVLSRCVVEIEGSRFWRPKLPQPGVEAHGCGYRVITRCGNL
ncbi:uncharacterized protein IWZ02DRAFT_495279 [Phyllosticta citriasiana]|uniref:uncharacterized protein n=1 Tax=Phyllosticta citriasiana TaxID=595635 RepID=UPI0030FDAE03